MKIRRLSVAAARIRLDRQIDPGECAHTLESTPLAVYRERKKAIGASEAAPVYLHTVAAAASSLGKKCFEKEAGARNEEKASARRRQNRLILISIYIRTSNILEWKGIEGERDFFQLERE